MMGSREELEALSLSSASPSPSEFCSGMVGGTGIEDWDPDSAHRSELNAISC